ncbi:MAG: amidohydrolase [Clostridiales bacterium]|nr:amidohydrolase [Clostridiales bacterium]
MIIDVHGHYMPIIKKANYENLFKTIKADDGLDYMQIKGKILGKLDEGLISIERQIEDLDKAGIDCRALCIPPFAFNYELSEKKSIEWSIFLNDQMFEDIKEYGERFIGLANLPMNSVSEACKELERTVRDYGFVGAQIATNINGIELDDESLYPFWEKAENLGAFILLHPHYTTGKERFTDLHLRNIIGNPLDTAIAGIRIIAGEIFRRFPNLKICLSHSGGYLPLAASRLDHAYEVRPEYSHLDSAPSTYLSRFYYDTIIHDMDALKYIISKVGIDRIVLGTDYPFDMGDLNPVASIKKLDVTDNEKRKIISSNAELMLKKALEVR